MVSVSPRANSGASGVNKFLLLLTVGMGAVIVILTMQLRGMDSELFDSLLQQHKSSAAEVQCPPPADRGGGRDGQLDRELEPGGARAVSGDHGA